LRQEDETDNSHDSEEEAEVFGNGTLLALQRPAENNDSNPARRPLTRPENISTLDVADVENKVRHVESRWMNEDKMLLTFADALLNEPSFAESQIANSGNMMVPLGSSGCCKSDAHVEATKIGKAVGQQHCKTLCLNATGCKAAQIRDQAVPQDESSSEQLTICTLFMGNGSVGWAASCPNARCFLKLEKDAMHFVGRNESDLPHPPTRELLGPLSHKHADERTPKHMEMKDAGVEEVYEVAYAYAQDALDAGRDILRGAREEEREDVNEEPGFLTWSSLQRIQEDGQGDDKKIVLYFGANVVMVFTALLLVFCLKGILANVYCPRRAGHSIICLVTPWTLCTEDSDEMVLASNGLDGLMLMKFLQLGIWILSATCLVNVLILVPGHLSFSPSEIYHNLNSTVVCPEVLTEQQCKVASNQLHSGYEVFMDTAGNCRSTPRNKVPVAEYQNVCVLEKLDFVQRLSMRRVLLDSSASDAGQRGIMWLDTASVLAVTIISLHAIASMMNEFFWRRQLYMLSTPARATVFVQGVPEDCTESGFSDFFEGLFPGRLLDVYRVQKSENFLQRTVRLVKGSATKEEFTPCGFVTFKSERDAQLCSQVSLSSRTQLSWQAEMAPEPSEIDWEKLGEFGSRRMTLNQIFSQLLFWLLFICCIVPVGMISVMAKVDNLNGIPYCSGLVNWIKTTLPDAFQKLPTAIVLAGFMSFLPSGLNYINELSGAWAQRIVDTAVERQYFRFLFFYVIVLNAASQSTFQFLKDIILSPALATFRIADGLSYVSTWYVTYIIFTFAGLAAELLRPYQLNVLLLSKMGLVELSDDWMAQLDESLGTTATRMCFYLSIAILYCTMAPIILPIACLAFFSACLIYRYKLLCVWRTEYDTGGTFVCTLIQNLHVGLFLYQIVTLGVLQLHHHHDGDSLWQSFLIFLAILVNYCYSRRHADEESYQRLALDTPLLKSQEKALGRYRPP